MNVSPELTERLELFKTKYLPILNELMPLLDMIELSNRYDYTDSEGAPLSSSYKLVSGEIEQIITFITNAEDPSYYTNRTGLEDRAFPTAEALMSYGKRIFQSIAQNPATDEEKAVKAARALVLLESLGDAFAKEHGFSGEFGGSSFIADLFYDIKFLYRDRKTAHEHAVAEEQKELQQKTLQRRMLTARQAVTPT